MPCVFGRFINAVKIKLFLSLKIGADFCPLLFSAHGRHYHRGVGGDKYNIILTHLFIKMLFFVKINEKF